MGLSRFFRRRFWDEQRARELDAYLAQETDDNVARGMTLDAARAAAHRKLGNPTRIREEIYTMNTLTYVDAAWRDLVYATRILRRNPGFAAVTILSLALGIGANTAIFQLLDAVEFRLLPVKAPNELVEIRPAPATLSRWGNSAGRRSFATNAMWEEIRTNQHSFSGLLAWGVNQFDLSTGGESRLIDGIWVSGSFFDVLGIVPQAGRLLTDRDDVRGCGSPSAVISHQFWQHEYGGAASAVGSTLRLSGHPFEIVGVTPPGFTGVEVGRAFDVAVPICSEPIVEPDRNAVAKRHYWWLDVIARLEPGVSVDRASAELAARSPAIFRATLAPQLPPQAATKFLAMKLTAIPAGTGVSYLRGTYQQPLWILLAVAGLVLLIACANLASLMLARATARDREIAVRLAIGASRVRIARQLMTESLLLAVIGAALSVLVAQALSGFLVDYISEGPARLVFDLAPDWRVLGFTCGVAAIACLLFGFAPAVRATRQTALSAMRTRGTTDGRARFGLRRALVTVQVALSLVLIVSSLLFVRTARNLATVKPGFRTADILIADFDTHAVTVPPAEQPRFERELRERIAAIPGVQGVADAAIEPLMGSIWNDHVVIDGEPLQTSVNENHVSPAFFRVLDIPILAGRDFTESDLPGTAYVAIVNETFAAKILNTTRPIGRTFKLEVPRGEPDVTYEVIGVVPDTMYGDVRDPLTQPIVYFPEAQMPTPDASLSEVQVFVRTTLPRSAIAPAITAAGRTMHPSTLVAYRSLQNDVEQTFLRERLMATLSGFFALLAVLLAIIGLYGVMSYMVARRRNEIGIRLALGAEASRVRGMIMREAGVLLIAGLIVGGVLAVFAAKTTATLLFGVRPSDPLTIMTSVAGLAIVGLVASVIPARRASRLEPTQALREE